MKQGTLLGMFIKTSPISGKVEQTESSSIVNHTAKNNGNTDGELKYKIDSVLQAKFSNAVVTETVFDVKLKDNDISSTDNNSKQSKSLSLSLGKRKLKKETKYEHTDLNNKDTNILEVQASNVLSKEIKSTDIQGDTLNSTKHSQPKINAESLSVRNLDTKSTSDVEEKKLLNSVGYEEFLSQIAQERKQESEASVHKLQPREDCQNKQTMSYSEFLKMFKPTPKDQDCKLANSDSEVETSPVPVNENPKGIKCKSIASYFSKTERKPQPTQASGSSTITVVAEVHSPLPQVITEESKKKQSVQTKKLPGKLKNINETSASDDKNEIQFLSSETITDVETVVEKKNLSTKKRINETMPLSLQCAKKQKIETKPQKLEKQNTEISVNFEKQIVETLLDNSIKLGVKTSTENSLKKEVITLSETETPDTPKSEDPDSVYSKSVYNKEEIVTACEKESGNIKENKTASLVALTQKLTVAKSSQSTLGFGKSGLSFVKVTETKRDDNLQIDTDNLDSAKRRSSRKSKADNENSKQRRPDKEDAEEVSEEKLDHKIWRNTTRKKVDMNDPGDLSKETQIYTKTGNTDVGEVEKDSVQQITVETTPLRRSARLTRSSKTIKELDVVEIGTDSEEDERLSESKQRGKRGGTAKTPVTGKLAPIFTSVKSKELFSKNVPQAVDPEQERLKREFLMSGIPEELKRQIAINANTSVLSDYPPFPKVSHVQQIVGNTCSPIVKIHGLRHASDDEDNEALSTTSLKWANLNWECTVPKNFRHQKNYFEKFMTNPPVQDSQIDLLLKELQLKDDKFPFNTVYGQLHCKTASLEFPGSRQLHDCSQPDDVIEDDDIVVVDESSPVSERLVVKHSSETKACLWTELHQPDSSEYIIGNSRAIKQLKHWLEEWKVLVEKQVQKASKVNKSAKKNKSTGYWTDDSDFTDSEEEEMALCNSVLITGPHGVGKTAAVYALAKELGYKVFEVNSSSLRSGKQLQAQLEEATQSHKVAQSKLKSPLLSDTPPAGTSGNKIEKAEKNVKCKLKAKQVSSSSVGFANLFFKTAPKPQDTASTKGNKSKLSLQEKSKKSEISKKISLKVPDLKMLESPLKKADRGKNKKGEEEIDTTKVKKKKIKESKGDVTRKQKGQKVETITTDKIEKTNADFNMASGSLNLQSASLILFDEVDIVFEEDKGFLHTVQQFMMSTKIPIVLTSADSSFSQQLQARHDHIKLHRPPLISAASFLSTLCLSHGVRVSHQSILNALHCMKGDIRRCLIHLQYWCESGGGTTQVQQDIYLVPSHVSVKENGSSTAVEKLKANKKFIKTVDPNGESDSDFISLRPPRKKLRRVCYDEEENSLDADPVHSNFSEKSSRKSSSAQIDISLERGDKQNLTSKVGNACKIQNGDLPLLHLRLEESLFGLNDCDISLMTILDFIKTPAMSNHGLDQAVQVCSIISQALDLDVIYHLHLHSLPLPKGGPLLTRLTLNTKQTESKLQTCKKSRKRIIQADWLDSDSSNAEEKNPIQDPPNDNASCPDKNVWDTSHSLCDESIPKVSPSEKYVVKLGASVENKSSNKLSASVLSELSRFYDGMSFTDCFESWHTSYSHHGNGIKLTPGLSDVERLSKQTQDEHENKLHPFIGYVKVMEARRLNISINQHIKNVHEQHLDGTDLKLTENVLSYKTECIQSGFSDSFDWSEEFQLPVRIVSSDLWNMANEVKAPSLSCDPAFKDVSKKLGPTVGLTDLSLQLDYMPYLREICRSEDQRHLAKSQRRFHHYLDNIGLGLKESTIASLTSMFTVTSSSQEL